MSNQRAIQALEKLELILFVDDARASTDPFKLPAVGTASLRVTVVNRRAALAAAIGATSLAEGDRAGASMICRTSLDRLERAHRQGYKFLAGLMPEWLPVDTGTGPYISDAERAQQYARYGFEGGVVGEFTDSRVEAMANQVPIAAAVTVGNALWHYPADLQDYIAAQLSNLNAHQSLAEGGTREAATQAMNDAADAAELVIARVRGHYISASDAGDRTTELTRIGLQRRRLPGEASDGVVPDAPGTAVYDETAKTLTIPAIPANANSIRAYRRKMGTTPGEVELCGISLNPVVSVVMAGPLDAASTYEAWVVGYDGNDEGPESNRVTITT